MKWRFWKSSWKLLFQTKQPDCSMFLRREEETGKHAYDFTHRSKEEKKKVTNNLPLKHRRCSTALLFNIIYTGSPSSRGSMLSSSVIRIKDICDTKSSRSIILSHNPERSCFALGLPSMKDSAKLTSEEETRCSTTLQTLNLNTLRRWIHSTVYT